MRKPESMDECVYFTRRELGEGKATAWVFKKKCDKCDGLLIKPLTKTGKPDKKATIYVCNKCNSEEDNESVESQLVVNIEYTCPHCKHESQATTEFKRKSFKGVPSFVFECENCHEKIGVTKKMKLPKSKK